MFLISNDWIIHPTLYDSFSIRMTLRAWELTVLTIAEAAPVDPRRGTAGSPSLQHICFKYLKKTDSGGGCIAWVCTRQQPFHDWTRLQEGYRKFVSLWGVIYFILKSGLIQLQHPRSQQWIDAAVLRESPAVALTSHRWRRSQSRRIRCLMAWKRGITVDRSGFIASYEPGGATRRRHERTGCRHGSGYVTFKWGCYRFFCFWKPYTDNTERKVVPQPPRQQRANLSSLSCGRCLSVGLGLSARTARLVTDWTFLIWGIFVVFCTNRSYLVFSLNQLWL